MARSLALLVLLASAPGVLSAQDGSFASLPQRAELGYFRGDQRRTFRDGAGVDREISWVRQGAFLKVALARTLAVEVNGLAWPEGGTNSFPARDFLDVTFGAGATWLPLATRHWRFGADVGYNEMNWIDQSAARTDIRTRQMAAALGTSLRWEMGANVVEFWGAPGMQIDWLDEFPPSGTSTTSRSTSNFGGAGGLSLRAGRHLRLAGKLSYFGFWEHQGSLSVQF